MNFDEWIIDYLICSGCVCVFLVQVAVEVEAKIGDGNLKIYLSSKNCLQKTIRIRHEMPQSDLVCQTVFDLCTFVEISVYWYKVFKIVNAAKEGARG